MGDDETFRCGDCGAGAYLCERPKHGSFTWAIHCCANPRHNAFGEPEGRFHEVKSPSQDDDFSDPDDDLSDPEEEDHSDGVLNAVAAEKRIERAAALLDSFDPTSGSQRARTLVSDLRSALGVSS